MRVRGKLGISADKAVGVLLKVLEEEGIDGKHAKAVMILAAKSWEKKRTINEEEDFEGKVRKILKKFKDKLNNGDYHETLEEMSKLFYDSSLLNRHYKIIEISLTMASVIVSIVIPVVLKFVG